MPTSVTDLIAAAKARPSDEFRFDVPYHVMLGEAKDLINFCRQHWLEIRFEASGTVLPGLVSAGEDHLPAATPDEMETLLDLTVEAQGKVRETAKLRSSDKLIERGGLVHDEIVAAMEWYFDDAVQDDKDAQLAAMKEAHADLPASADALAVQLEETRALALPHRDALAALPGFDVATLDEVPALTKALRDVPSVGVHSSPEQQAALAWRNRVLQLLDERMRRVRAAARFVFRRHPELVRQTTSVYARTRRAARRRAAAEKAPVPS